MSGRAIPNPCSTPAPSTENVHRRFGRRRKGAVGVAELDRDTLSDAETEGEFPSVLPGPNRANWRLNRH